MKGNHGDIVLCQKCNRDTVEPVPVEGHSNSEFSFAITRRKNGTPVDPPFLGTIQLVQCTTCDYQFALMDSPKSLEHWSSLPKWEGALQ